MSEPRDRTDDKDEYLPVDWPPDDLSKEIKRGGHDPVRPPLSWEESGELYGDETGGQEP